MPYGWWHENPPVIQDAPWPDEESQPHRPRRPATSCHSNETDWPLYTYVAPMSWLVRRDVEDGRDELNFSDWSRDADEADDAVEVIASGAMPPGRYTLIHRDAELSADEQETLVRALLAMSDDDDG